MSKSGRYSADRKKIEALTTSATEIQVHDCGTIFMLDGTSYSADVTHSLPHPSEAGEGWWCKFIVKTAVLDAGGDDCLIKIRAAGASTFVDNLLLLQVHETTGAAGLTDVDADFVTVTGETIGGSQLEFVCDGNKYYMLGSVVADGAITVDT
tara:strand:- start:22950 stop:23405 length:456 start_codon:yes stop_codon:yes gene_type:complete